MHRPEDSSVYPASPRARGTCEYALRVQRKRSTLLLMKSAVIAKIRVEPELPAQLEAVLR